MENNEKKINILDMVLFTVCGIVVLDTVGASAAIGVSSITWWVISIFLFFLPYGLISAELGSTFPGDGGIYNWTKLAYGDFHATLVSWFYWVNVAYWMPSVYVMFSGIFTTNFAPNAGNVIQAAIAIVLVWITVWICLKDVSVSKWIPNIGAVCKMVILILLGLGGIVYGIKHGFANNFSLSDFAISWDQSLSYVPVIVFNFMGFELISSVGDKLKDPKKDIPKATILAGVLISGLYIFATFGLLAAIPTKDINVVTGVTDALNVMLVQILGKNFTWLFKILCVVVLFTFISNMVTWAIGSNSVISETGLDKKSPGIFGHKHKKYGTPDYALYLMGVIGTVLILGNYAGTGSVAEIFWTIFSLSSIIFLLPYLWMFPAAVTLRKKYPDVERPYSIPGGKAGLYLSSFLGEFFIAFAVIFFFKPPEGTESVLRYELSLILTVVVTFAIGLYIYFKTNKKQKTHQNSNQNIGE